MLRKFHLNEEELPYCVRDWIKGSSVLLSNWTHSVIPIYRRRKRQKRESKGEGEREKKKKTHNLEIFHGLLFSGVSYLFSNTVYVCIHIYMLSLCRKVETTSWYPTSCPTCTVHICIAVKHTCFRVTGCIYSTNSLVPLYCPNLCNLILV